MAASARRHATPPTAATSTTPRRRLLPTPTPRPARRAALPDAALSPGGALRRDLEAATSVARRLVAALSGGEQPSADAALPDLLREAAARAAELRSAAMRERELRLEAESARAEAERRAALSDEGARKASTERDKALDDAKVAQDAAQAARAARDATQATYHGLTKRTATLDAELAGLRAERRASRRGIAVLRRSRSRDRVLSETVEERLDSASLQLSKARETQREERQRATHYAQELSNQQLTHRKFAADCAVALRAAEVDRGLWRLKSGLKRHHLALRSIAYQRLMDALRKKRPASPIMRRTPSWSQKSAASAERRRDALRRQGTAIAGYY